MKYMLLIFTLVFSACSVKNYDTTEAKIIIIKSPKIKFSDLGYVRNSQKSIELELFMAGKSIEKITINHLICTSEGCMTKSSFNKEYLNENYPADTLQNIILGDKIYGEVGFVKSDDGFEQRVKNEYVDIIYKVDSKKIFFKDLKNRIIFKIKDIDVK